METEQTLKTFEHKGKKFITINGKEYYLLQAFTQDSHNKYRVRGEMFIFLQVAGRSSLHNEDLPEKNWEIVKTKTPQGVIYTAYDTSYFDWETAPEERSESKKSLLFVGRTKAGSLYLALHACARLLRIAVSQDDLKDAVRRGIEKNRTFPLLEMKDEGNEGNTAYLLKGFGNLYQEMGERDFKELIEKPKTNGRRKRK